MIFRRTAPVVAALLVGGLVGSPTASAHPAPTAGCGVTDLMVKASSYWVATDTDQAANNWSNALFHVGNLAQVRTTGVSNHKTWPWTEANRWLLPTDPARPFAADAQASGEAYLDVWYFHQEDRVLDPLRAELAAEAASVAQGHTRYWTTPDALNLSLPSFTRVGVMDSNQALLDASGTLFRDARKRLFSDLSGLWLGNAQANGFAVSGLAKAVLALPADSPPRAEYARTLRRSAEALRWAQRPDGFWNAELLFGGKESSSTALITYALAAGINAGVLDRAAYLPVVRKGWEALTTVALRDSGRLGYVQARGSHRRAGADDSAAFAVGAFLTAGQQVAALTPGC
ncbi:glycoside hydrolase family 88 protein [Umezawaea endophytica]|uniref:Glycoside hydrolase family 88 protein n=1 Tax=Umezawaea endophytica TaxID=1654476 RepID=A0A9X2VNL6_9PSEU|nr:glycoside hydrolase family 88 protein [Umezawaea endophytica]MCS7479816.1 glycoside hydrolase family 88 protein [Umezawaea endophytica]